jgi:hypothetical protein
MFSSTHPLRKRGTGMTIARKVSIRPGKLLRPIAGFEDDLPDAVLLGDFGSRTSKLRTLACYTLDTESSTAFFNNPLGHGKSKSRAPTFLDRTLSARQNRSKACGKSSAAMPVPVSANPQSVRSRLWNATQNQIADSRPCKAQKEQWLERNKLGIYNK